LATVYSSSKSIFILPFEVYAERLLLAESLPRPEILSLPLDVPLSILKSFSFPIIVAIILPLLVSSSILSESIPFVLMFPLLVCE